MKIKAEKIMRILINLLIFIIPLLSSGCASTITAKPEGGIPYYLPRPYLLITKNITPLIEKTVEKKDEKANTITIERSITSIQTDRKNEDFYSFQIIYLPDLTQKYFLDIQARAGEIKTNINLIDGWKLVGINLEADAKTSDTIKAIGEIIPKLPIEKGFMDKQKEKEVEIWLYEIKVEYGKLRYDLVLKWPEK